MNYNKSRKKIRGGKPFVGKFCREISTLTKHSEPVLSVAFHSIRNLLATVSEDNTVRLWHFNDDGSNIRCISSLNWGNGLTHQATYVAFHPSRNLLAIGLLNNTANLWSFSDDGSNPICRGILRGHFNWITSLAFHSSRNLLVTASADMTIKLWSFNDDGSNPVFISSHLAHENRVTSVAFHPSRNILATGSIDSSAKLWSFNDDGLNIICIGYTYLSGFGNEVKSVAFHPSGNLLATGSSDSSAKLWSFNEDRSNLNLVLTGITDIDGHTDSVLSVAFHSKGNLLVTGSRDSTVKLWTFKPDGSNLVCIETLPRHPGFVNSVAFHPSRNILATGSRDNTVKLWDCHKLLSHWQVLRDLTKGSLATSLIGKLTEFPEVQRNQSFMKNILHKRLGIGINTPVTIENAAEIKATKYLELLPRESSAQSDSSTGLTTTSVKDSSSQPVLKTPPVNNFCASSDTSCISLYDSIPWSRLNSIPEDCAEALELLDKLVSLESLLNRSSIPEKDSKLSLITLWIKKLISRIDHCRR